MLSEPTDQEMEEMHNYYQSKTAWQYGDMVVCFSCSEDMIEHHYEAEDFKQVRLTNRKDCDKCGCQLSWFKGEY